MFSGFADLDLPEMRLHLPNHVYHYNGEPIMHGVVNGNHRHLKSGHLRHLIFRRL